MSTTTTRPANCALYLAEGKGIVGDDAYRRNIVNAARVLVAEGYSEATYNTQWLSGTTSWRHNGHYLSVSTDGVITR